jgi:hypothetical protein
MTKLSQADKVIIQTLGERGLGAIKTASPIMPLV